MTRRYRVNIGLLACLHFAVISQKYRSAWCPECNQYSEVILREVPK